jgi:archaellum component FlaC
MDDLKRLEDKIDKIVSEVSSVNLTLAAQHVTLENHIARTEALEEQVQPLKEAHTELKGVIKFVKIIGVLLAMAEAIRLLWK